MQVYLSAYGAKQHETPFGWKAFRVLTVTTDDQRMRSMQAALRELQFPSTPGAGLFFFATRLALRRSDPFVHTLQDGNGHLIKLINRVERKQAA